MKITPKKTAIEHARAIGALANGVFQHRRKIIRNALLEATNLGLDEELVCKLLRETGIDASLRADRVTVDQFGKMAESLLPKNKCSLTVDM